MKFSASIILAFVVSGVHSIVTPCSLEVVVNGPENVNSTSFPVIVTLKNTCPKTYTLLKDPNSILTPAIRTDKFIITPSPLFSGIAVRWSPSLALEQKSFTKVEPGQTLEFNYNLGRTYDFSGSGPGTYEVTTNDYFYSVTSPETFETITASVTPLITHLS